ncbi:hypothetical protein BKA00_001386 [Actinomadura coerulea]|uniref:Uncharacterized protein n=1 Tax=Actinomadura coerulea TaxID=46159 RepID=A0A7X0KXM1_9ACTN|nr:hypothetical protein [Actinomadura coerulea]MBB6394472.1 hypothetical protein [Actinomadura coerulea]
MAEAARTLRSAPRRAGISPIGSLTTLEMSAKDRRVGAAFARWSACMKRAGRFYANPRDATRDRRFLDRPEHRVGPLETATAVADVHCEREVRLVDVWAGVEAAHQKRAIARNRPALDAERQARDAPLKKATEVPARPGR